MGHAGCPKLPHFASILAVVACGAALGGYLRFGDLTPAQLETVAVVSLLVGTAVGLVYFRTRNAARCLQRAQRELEQQIHEQTAGLAEHARLASFQANIGSVLTHGNCLTTKLQNCAEAIVKHLDAAFTRIWIYRAEQGVLELQASAGLYTHRDGEHARIPLEDDGKIGIIARRRLPHLTNAVLGDPAVKNQEWARREGLVAFAGYPLAVEERLVGVVAAFARRPLPESALQSLGAVADEIALGIVRDQAEAELRLSEERFRIAAENGGDLIFECDTRTGRFELFGLSHRQLGYSGDDLPRTLDEWRNRLHPEDRERIQRAFDRMLQSGEPLREELRFLLPDGTVRCHASKMALGEDGRVIGVATDITERKRTEAVLLHMATIVESSDAAIISMNPDGTVLTWNASAQRIFGYSLEEMQGRRITKLYLPGREDEIRELQAILARGERVVHLETQRLRKDGVQIHVLLTLSPLRGFNDMSSGVVSIYTDITERKRLESQLSQAQKLESIGQLAAGIAHEINTPIQYVGDNIRFLRDSFARLEFLFHKYDQRFASDAEPASLAADLRAIDKSVKLAYLRTEIPKALEDSLDGATRVADIVRAIKAFSHPGPSEKSPVDLNQAIESTVLVSRNEWKYVADLEMDLEPDLPSVYCVAGEINQVLLNLIVNAAHAIGDVVAGAAGTKGHIAVSTRLDGEWVEIRVRDTGGGIPESVQPHIFNPFFTTKTVGKGTGQGLSIAHNIVVQKHLGSITFDTKVGVGTTFLIRLPLDSAEPPDSDSTTEQLPQIG